MLVSVVPIGNSKGIRIPQSILKQLNIKEQVELEVHEKDILIRPVEKQTRNGWVEAFTTMHENGDDELIIESLEPQEIFQWEW